MNPLFAPRPGLLRVVTDLREALEPPAFNIEFRGSIEVPERQAPAVYGGEPRTYHARDFAAKAGMLRVSARADTLRPSERGTGRARPWMSAVYVPRHCIVADDHQPLAVPEHERRFRLWLAARAVGSTAEERAAAEAEAWR